GLTHTLYRPPVALRRRIAPTGEWHGHAVAGEVNDRNAARLGGVAGHAGLFARAPDVARFAQWILHEGALPDGRHVVRSETVRLFTTKAADFGHGTEARALGWQAVPTGETVSSAGTEFGPRSFGHTGWTGTSLWIDPDRGGDARRVPRPARLRRCRRRPGDPATAAGAALDALALRDPRCAARGAARVRLGRAAPPLCGARLCSSAGELTVAGRRA